MTLEKELIILKLELYTKYKKKEEDKMAVWRLQVNTGGTNAANYCLKNHVAAMGWSLRELTQAERSGIHTFLDYCKLARTQYKSFDSVCRMVEDGLHRYL